MTPIRVLFGITLALAAVAALVAATAALAGPLRVDLRLAATHFASTSNTASSAPLADHPPFRDRLDLAVDAGELDRARVTATLTEALTAWFGPGNVRLVPMPAAGALVTRPLLVVRILGPAGPWRPWGARANLRVEALAVDGPDAVRWPDLAPAALAVNHPLNGLGRNSMYRTDDISGTVTGLLPRWAFQEELIQRATRPIVAHLVDVAQQEAPAPRVPAPPMASLLSVDWSQPFTLRCAGVAVPFKVRFEDGSWERAYEPSYVQDQTCDWAFTLVNTSGRDLTLTELAAPAFQFPDIVEFGEAHCQAAGETAGTCEGRNLEPDATIAVRVPMRFDACERYPAGGSVSYRLDQAVVGLVGGARRSLSLPWSTKLTLTRPPDSACPARFPGPATRAAIAAWLGRTLDPTVLAGTPITAEDVVFKDDVFDNRSAIGNDRLGTFVVKRPDHTCVGVARFRREPDLWYTQPSRPGEPLFTERLIGHAVHCMPDTQMAAEGGAGIRVALHGEEGKDLQVAVGLALDPRSRTVELRGDDRPYPLGDITDGVFTFYDFGSEHADLPTWRLVLRPAAYDSEPSGTLDLAPVDLTPAAAP